MRRDSNTERTERARAAFEFSPAALAVFDDQWVFVDVNRAATMLLRRSYCDLVRMPLSRFCSPEQFLFFSEQMARRGSSGSSTSDIEVLDGAGSAYCIEIFAQEGSPATHYTFLRDVTQQRAMQRELEHHNRLREIGKLASGVAHDFNNMLTAILSYTDLLLERPSADDGVHRYAQGIRAAAESAAETAQQLLSFCRGNETKITAVDVNSIVRECAALIQRLVQENIRIVLKLKSALPPIRADAAQLRQVLINLAVNARDAMPAGGDLIFSTDLNRGVLINGLEVSDECVQISVQDSGLGIDDATLPHIFEPFFTTKTDGRGTGLGLSTVHGIVRHHHAEISVKSAPGRGTTFLVAFPINTSTKPLDSKLRVSLEQPAFEREQP